VCGPTRPDNNNNNNNNNKEATMARRLTCPCGEGFREETDDELVTKVQEHLAKEHPDHQYSRDEILFLAY
jgi:hypothetical protein